MRYPFLSRARRPLVLLATLGLLSACGGGDGISDWFASLAIYSISAPDNTQVKSSVTVTARAITTGDINDSDMEWIWDQTSGSDVSDKSQENIGKSSVLHFTAPASSGTIKFKVTAKGRGLADSANFTINVYD